MSPFEFISVMGSIVVALGITCLLGGVADLIRWWRDTESRVFFLFLQLTLLSHLIGWWFGLWARHAQTNEFTLGTYLLVLQIPATLFVAARLLVPERGRDSAPDWVTHFASVRVPFFLLLASTVTTQLHHLWAGTQGFLEYWPIYAWCGAYAVGALTADRRVHWLIVSAAGALLWGFFLSMRPAVGL